VVLAFEEAFHGPFRSCPRLTCYCPPSRGTSTLAAITIRRASDVTVPRSRSRCNHHDFGLALDLASASTAPRVAGVERSISSTRTRSHATQWAHHAIALDRIQSA
jgi:hypothetical protein